MKDFIDVIPIGAEPVRNQIEWHPLKNVGDQNIALPRGELFLNDSLDHPPDLILLQSQLRIRMPRLQSLDRPVREIMANPRMLD